MKQLFLGLLMCLAFSAVADDAYTVKKVEGFVQYQAQNGTWIELTSDITLREDTVLSTGLNANVTLLNSSGSEIFIKPMKKGMLSEIIEKQLKTSITLSNAGPIIVTVNETTNDYSVRASEAVEDVIWVSDEE